MRFNTKLEIGLQSVLLWRSKSHSEVISVTLVVRIKDKKKMNSWWNGDAFPCSKKKKRCFMWQGTPKSIHYSCSFQRGRTPQQPGTSLPTGMPSGSQRVLDLQGTTQGHRGSFSTISCSVLMRVKACCHHYLTCPHPAAGAEVWRRARLSDESIRQRYGKPVSERSENTEQEGGW